MTAPIVGSSDSDGGIEALLRRDIMLIKQGKELGFPKLSRREIQDRFLKRITELLKPSLELTVR